MPQRNPVVLAKQIASLDVLSGGRFTLGIGVGYLEPEFRAIGADFEHRGAVTDEFVDAMQTLWYDEQPEHHGRFVDFGGVDAHPRPVQRPIPLVVGGHTPAAYRRAVSRGHGWYGFGMTPEAAAASLEGLRAAAGPGRPPGRARRAGDHRHAARPADRRDGDRVRRRSACTASSSSRTRRTTTSARASTPPSPRSPSCSVPAWPAIFERGHHQAGFGHWCTDRRTERRLLGAPCDRATFVGLPSPVVGRAGAGGHPCQGIYHAPGRQPPDDGVHRDPLQRRLLRALPRVVPRRSGATASSVGTPGSAAPRRTSCSTTPSPRSPSACAGCASRASSGSCCSATRAAAR